jgi:Reverse transcriptase (RNA-dependent DNA polymerase)
VSKVNKRVVEDKQLSDSFRVELDSNADTTCVGNGVLIINETDRFVNATPFIKSLGMVKKVPIVSAAIAYDDPRSGKVYILVIHQALYFKEMIRCLLCPMQLRLHDVTINERPKFLTDKPIDTDHTIIIEDLIIPLEIHKVSSFFYARKPSLKEYNECERLELTCPFPEWNPHDIYFAEEEAKYLDDEGYLIRQVNQFNQVTYDEHNFLTNINGWATNISTVDSKSFEVLAIQSNKFKLTPDILSKNWGIGQALARRTIDATTQLRVRSVANPSIERRWPTGDRPLRYKRLNHPVYHDTMYSTVKSLRGNKCCEVYVTDFGWSRVFPMKTESDVHESLDIFLSRYGIPEALISDGAKAYTGGEFRKKARQAGIYCKLTDPYSPWQNRAESEIRELKRLSTRWMLRTGSPERLWDDAIELASIIRSHMALDIYKLNGQVPETVMLGQTADISFIYGFAWYDWVYYNDPVIKFPEAKSVLGRYLGPTEPEAGSVLSAKILTNSGEVVRRNTFRVLTTEEQESESVKQAQATFNESVKKRLGNAFTTSDDVSAQLTFSSLTIDDEESICDNTDHLDTITGNSNDFDPEVIDGYISAQVLLPRDDQYQLGKVIKRSVDGNAHPVGKAHSNPILDTREYLVEFDDGTVLEYAANVIAENLYSTVDSEGKQYLLMDSIVAHKSDDTAVSKGNEFVVVNNKQHPKKTTSGWWFQIQWKDGRTTWEPLKALKESNPVELAEYVVANNISSEPAFSWWVPYTISRKNRIVAAVNKRYMLRTHKFGIRIPKTVEEALQLDKENGNTFWRDAIALEAKNVDVAFQELEEGEAVPVGYQFVRCHMIFDVKVGSLKRKARYVAGGHLTEPPSSLTYASVVSRESIRIGLLIAALNDLDILAADIQNAYLTSPCEEKIYTILGPEFGPHRQGKKAVVVRALYGLKSAGAAFRNHLASCLQHLGFTSSKGDPDVWLRAAVKANGEEYYEYMFVYTDDILAVSEDPKSILMKLNKYFKLKPDSIQPPDDYLGTKIKLTTLPNGQKAWGQSSSHYVRRAVQNVEDWIAKEGYKQLPRKAKTPMVSSYKPELDVSTELDADKANYYQSLVGVLRWIIELGRLDITTEVSMLAAHMAAPREGHLQAVFQVFAYLKQKHNARLIYDPTYPTIDVSQFKLDEDWTAFYGDMKEAIPPNAPKPRGRGVVLRMFVDSDHAGNMITRRSRTGFVQMINNAVINWYSKKQGSVESSTFGSEFVALKTAMEANRGLRYKLRMMGVPLDGPTHSFTAPTFVFGDNQSVIANTTKPESLLKKKSNAIAYHAVREAVAMNEMTIAYIPSEDNVADLFTKVLPPGQKRAALVEKLLWDITHSVETEMKTTLDRLMG